TVAGAGLDDVVLIAGSPAVAAGGGTGVLVAVGAGRAVGDVGARTEARAPADLQVRVAQRRAALGARVAGLNRDGKRIAPRLRVRQVGGGDVGGALRVAGGGEDPSADDVCGPYPVGHGEGIHLDLRGIAACRVDAATSEAGDAAGGCHVMRDPVGSGDGEHAAF